MFYDETYINNLVAKVDACIHRRIVKIYKKLKSGNFSKIYTKDIEEAILYKRLLQTDCKSDNSEWLIEELHDFCRNCDNSLVPVVSGSGSDCPDDAIITEDGICMITEDGVYIIVE